MLSNTRRKEPPSTRLLALASPRLSPLPRRLLLHHHLLLLLLLSSATAPTSAQGLTSKSSEYMNLLITFFSKLLLFFLLYFAMVLSDLSLRLLEFRVRTVGAILCTREMEHSGIATRMTQWIPIRLWKLYSDAILFGIYYFSWNLSNIDNLLRLPPDEWDPRVYYVGADSNCPLLRHHAVRLVYVAGSITTLFVRFSRNRKSILIRVRTSFVRDSRDSL